MFYDDFGPLYAFNSYEADTLDGFHFAHIAEWRLHKLLMFYGVI